MNKGKAWFVAAVIAVMLAAVIWMMWDYALRSFWVMALIFAGYGYVCFIFRLEKWLEMDVPEPRHQRRIEDEDDAAIWEHAGAVTTTEGKA